MATVHGKLKGVGDSDEDPNATVDIMLCGYGSRSPACRGVGGENGSFYTSEWLGIKASLPGNEFTATVPGNDIIVPAGTYYTVTFRDGNGDILQCNAYIFLGDNDYNLTYTDPYDPTQPPPPLPPLIIPQLLIIPTDNPAFPGDRYTAWKITLDRDITTAALSDILPGNLYTFIVVQDATGGHRFNFPAGTHNFCEVCPEPGSTTVQTFVADESGVLWAIAPGTWS